MATQRPTDDMVTDAATLAPISRERICTALESLEVNFGTDEDGDLISGFNGNPCWFGLTGPEDALTALSFHTRWHPVIDPDQLPEALSAVNEWNSSQLFPRAMCINGEDENLLFVADYLQDYEFGVTDRQLCNDLSIAITTALNFYDFLAELFPESLDEDPLEAYVSPTMEGVNQRES